jgi:formylglycine-generating enzyme required for sulfatase activity
VKHVIIRIAIAVTYITACGSVSAEIPTAEEYTNAIAIKLVRIEPGSFQMGQINKPLPSEILPMFRGRGKLDMLDVGDFDEAPVHPVKITKPFYMAVFEVTNFQYEMFDPEHKQLRGKNGFSKEDDDAVVHVNWYQAQAFCRWLSDKEGLSYRLPTEAEWEYACRAGTTTNYYPGDILPKEFEKTGGKTSLQVGQTAPNAWGLYDMHGGVEEWCYDWYGPYQAEPQTDPVGYTTGDFRVLRGASHSTPSYYLRSANRMGQLPECKNWLMGFRVVLAQLPQTRPLTQPVPLNQQEVIQRDPKDVTEGPDPEKPYFRGPYKFVKIPTDGIGPLFASHNHDPAIVECPNGDLVACWYTCVDEGARELAQAASRLVWGQHEWQPASPFWDAPDRNDHAPAMWFDDKNTIYHFTGVGADGGRGRMVMVMRTSTDSGATWSAPRAITPDFAGGHQLSEPVFRMHDGTIVLTIDGKKTLWMSKNEGMTWTNAGGDIKGIHAGVTQLKDGTILAFSRSNGGIDGKMPISFSKDAGKSFQYKPSEFQPIGGGQRLVLLRLRQGPLFFASFAGLGDGMQITDSTGTKRNVRGLFTAISEDEGKTWPYKRLVSDDGPGRNVECTDGGAIRLSAHSSEYRGYLAACQSTDGLIHLISSRNHYAFNLKWLKTTPPPALAQPYKVQRAVETFSGPDFDNRDWVIYKGFKGGFNDKGQYTVDAHVHYQGLNRVVGTGSFEAFFSVTGSFEAFFSVKNIHYNPPGANISEGATLGFKDAFNKHNPSMLVWIKENGIGGNVFDRINLPKPPTAVKLRLIWNRQRQQWRIFYGLDGQEPTTEIPESKTGLYYQSPTSESCAAFFLMSNGRMEIDHFEIKPVEF